MDRFLDFGYLWISAYEYFTKLPRIVQIRHAYCLPLNKPRRSSVRREKKIGSRVYLAGAGNRQEKIVGSRVYVASAGNRQGKNMCVARRWLLKIYSETV